MVGISWKDEGLCLMREQIPSPKDTLYKEINPKYRDSGCDFSCMSACLWRGTWWLCLVEPLLVAKAEVNIHFSFIGF